MAVNVIETDEQRDVLAKPARIRSLCFAGEVVLRVAAACPHPALPLTVAACTPMRQPGVTCADQNQITALLGHFTKDNNMPQDSSDKFNNEYGLWGGRY
jgi:hypothetical protein